MANQNADQFNANVERNNKENYKRQIESEKEKFEQKINEILKNLGTMSQSSQQAMTLFQKMLALSPLLQELGAAVTTVDSDVYYTLYMKFRNVFKQFSSSADECTKMSQQSINGKFNAEKLEEIKNTIQNVANSLNQIKQNVYSDIQRYVIWVDFNDSKENKETLLKIQAQHQNSMTVKFYTKINAFQQDFTQFEGQPLFLILSGQVANDYAATDGKLFSWIKNKWQQNPSKIRIKGIIIYTSIQGVKFIKDKFMEDSSKLVRSVTYETDDMLNTLQNIISPSKFTRIVGIEELSHFFQSDLKDKLLKMHTQPAMKKIMDFHPNKINLAQIFNEAEQLVKQNKINFDAQASQFQIVLEHLLAIFNKHNDETQLSKALINLYTLEKVPFYKLINTSLNTMNEKLITKLWPVIELFYTVLFRYNDSMYPESIKVGSQDLVLYRGSSIPNENFDDLCKVNNFITLPSFSSFTPDLQVALNFVLQNSYPSTKLCVFRYCHNSIGNKQYDMRPKYISNDSKFSQEKEFLTYPCVTYKIQSIEQKYHDAIKDYYEIRLILN